MARTTSCLTVSVSGCSNLNDPIEIPIESGPHTLQVRSGRNSSRTLTFDAAEGEIVAFRCSGKRILPIFLASFVVPSLHSRSSASRRDFPNQRASGQDHRTGR